MLSVEIIDVCSEVHRKYSRAPCGKNIKFLSVEVCDT